MVEKPGYHIKKGEAKLGQGRQNTREDASEQYEQVKFQRKEPKQNGYENEHAYLRRCGKAAMVC